MKKLVLLLSLVALMLSSMAQDLSSGLLVYYPFDGNADDASASGSFDGTVVGAALVDGYDGAASSAYDFDGINDQIVFGDIDLSTSSFTISFWLKLPDLPVGGTSYRMLSKRAGCTASQFFDISVSNTGDRGYNVGMELRDDNVSGSVNTGNILFPQEWFHVTFVKDNDTDKSYVYVNGLLASEASWSSAVDLNVDNTAPLGIGNSPCISQSTVSPFKGSIDEVRIHDRVLTSQEMKSMIPFHLQYSAPYDGEMMASVSSGITLEFAGEIDQTGVDGSSFTVTGAVAGVLTPTVTFPATNIAQLNFASDLPFGETIDVTVTDVPDLDGNVASGNFSFTTATEEESLVAHYLFDGSMKDTTANDFNFSEPTSFSYVNDRLRESEKAVQFSETEGALLATNDLMNVGRYKDFSISFWMKSPQTSTQRHIIDNLSTGRFSVILSTGGQLWLRLTSGDTEEVLTTERFDDNQWHHVTMTADRDAEYKIYVDGVLRATQAFGSFVNLQNSNSWHFNENGNGTNRYAGILDDFRFYNRELSENEAKDLAPIYVFTSPTADEVAARPDTDIEFEFGQSISAATAIAANFTITGSSSGTATFTIAGGDSRVVKLTPDSDFELDETITVTYDNLESESGEILSGSYTFETADVDKGMLVHYPFDGDASNAVSEEFDGVVSGATLTNGFDGTASSAYQFDGNDQITIGQLGLDKESYAIGFWINRDASTTRGEILGQRQFCTGSDFMEMSATYNQYNGKYEVVMVMAKTSGGFQSYSVRAEITPGEWAHIVAERDAQDGVIRMYKNGALVSETAYSSSYSILNDATMSLGGGNACIGVDGRGRFSGTIDDLRIYRRSISAEEVAKFSDFMVEGTYPAANSVKQSATSSVFIDFNEDIDETTFSAGNVSVTASGGSTLAYSTAIVSDTLRIKPDTEWPAGETISVEVTDIESINGELLSHSFLFEVSTDEESLLLSFPFDGDFSNAGATEYNIAAVADINFVEDKLLSANTAADFSDGANYVEIRSSEGGVAPEFNFGTESDFTIMTWFKSSFTGSQHTFFNKRANDARMHAYVKSTGELSLRFVNSNEDLANEVVTEMSYMDGFWHHVAFVADRDGQLAIIVDGVEVATEDAISINANILSTARVGAIENATQVFQGTMDDFRIYNKAFTASQVLEIAPAYAASNPADGYDAVDLDQQFELDFLWAVDAATAIPANFTLEGADSGAKTVTVTGGDTRLLTISGDSDFVADEEITLSFSNLLDTLGNVIEDKTFTFEATGVNKGMFVYYPMSGDALNQVSEEYHGQITGATVAPDRNGTADEAYSFDGNSYIQIGDLPITDQSFSISMWMKRDELQQSQALIGYRGHCSASPQMNLNCSWSSTLNSYVVSFSTGGTNKSGTYQNYGTSTPISADTWTHVSVVRDNAGSLLKIYINGSLEAIQSINNEINIGNTATFGIGSGNACINVDATRRFTGDVDELRIYNRAITDEEAAALPNLVTSPPSIVGSVSAIDIDEDAVAMAVAKVDTLFSSSEELDYSVVSSNENVNAYLDGLDLMIEPAADFNGSAEIEVSASSVRKSSLTFTVNVAAVNDAPVLTAGADLDLLEDFTGVEQIAVTVTQPADEATQGHTFSISPDPSTVDFASVSFNSSTGIVIVSAVENGFGSQVFTVTADDGQAANNTGSVDVTVTVNAVNDAPEFELESSTITLTQNFEGTASYTLTDLSPANEDAQTITYSIDPASVAFANVSLDANTGEVSVTAVADGLGSQLFTITADDGQAVSNTFSASFTLEVVENFAPEVVNAIADVTLNEDATLVVSSDITAVFTDQDGDVLTYEVTSDNAGVIPAINGNELSISLQADFNGSAVISLSASDDAATATDEIAVTVTPVNDAPIMAVAIADQTAPEDDAFSITTPAGQFTDVDGDILSVESVTFTGQGKTDGSWLTYNSTSGEISGTPGQANVGVTVVAIVVTDGSLTATDEFTVTVSNVNDAPVVSNATSVTLDEDAAAITIDLNTVFSDEDEDDLAYGFISTKGKRALEVVATVVVNSSLDGTILTITPIEDANGSMTIGLTASDGTESVEYHLPVTVNPINDEPEVVSQPTLSFEEDGAAQTIDISTIFTDVDGDELTFGIVGKLIGGKSAATDVVSYSLHDAILTVTPIQDQFGTQNIQVTASDNSITTSYNLQVTVTGVNDLPAIIFEPSLAFNEDDDAQTVDLSTIFTDVDGDALTYSLAGSKTIGTALVTNSIDGAILTVTPEANANGTVNVAVVANDGSGETGVTYSLPVAITAVNDAPEFSLGATALTLDQDFAGTETIAIMAGDAPADEAEQTVTYTITPDDGSLVNFTVTATGIEVTAVAGAFGESTFTIEANDGQDANNLFAQTFTVTVNKALALDDEVVMSIYPNPAVDYVQVRSKNVLKVNIYNLEGAEVRTGFTNEKIYLNNVESGVYLIITTDEKGLSRTNKLIIRD
ncbi:MAG: LamG-like jellyroll fold domain-containing protein [Cyclobacteriaceae bacterium]